MHALLCANAPFSDSAAALLLEVAQSADLLVGVDGGARTLSRYSLLPHLVTGDGDSLSEQECQALRAAGVQLVPTPDQDYTDLDKALAYVIAEHGATELTVFGATGGRLDHSYSVFSTLLKHGKHTRVQLIDETARYEAIQGQWHCTGPELVGRTLSLLAFGRVEGVTTTGLRWPLTDDWLAPGHRDGTLNQVVESTITVQVGSGELIVMLHHL
ncbi:thiamine diphosphokinase [Armatimonas rosea]|uniref:Thiamine diphosphokinase n=1 Tax=Armatimonas rosea TaxID=685828 RepID=A0A7W9SMM6_ARMRO|nr:thiamine diphosphokinase [Armatimonas rosea]MBB6048984.1 thiamine pyrophosphokinase [Armatimonas rosea]